MRLAGTQQQQVTNLDIELSQGHGSHPAFGQRLNIPNNTGPVDVWPGIATTRPLPLAPKPMFLTSLSAEDTFGGPAGAQLVLVTFIDELGDWRNSDLIVMQGLSQVPITYKHADGILGNASRMPRPPSPPGAGSIAASIFRVIDVTVVVAAGATEAQPQVSNKGELRVVGGGGTVFEVVPAGPPGTPGAGRSRSAAFHCPRGHTARLTYAPIGTARGQGTAYIASNYGLGTAWSILPVAAVESFTALFKTDPPTTPIYERADVQGKVATGQNAIDISFLMQFRVFPIP